MKLHCIVINVHPYSPLRNRDLQWDEGKNWSSASGVALLFAMNPADLASFPTITLPTAPWLSVFTYGDASEDLNGDTPITKLLPCVSVYFFARRCHYRQRGGVLIKEGGPADSSWKPETKRSRREETAYSAGQSADVKTGDCILSKPSA